MDEAKRNGKKLEEANDRLGRELESMRKLVESTSSEKGRDMEKLLAQLEERRRHEDKLQGELVDAIDENERLRREYCEQKQQLEDLVRLLSFCYISLL